MGKVSCFWNTDRTACLLATVPKVSSRDRLQCLPKERFFLSSEPNEELSKRAMAK